MTKVRMSEYPTPFIFDIQALRSWALATGNEAQLVWVEVQQGTVLIYNRLWREFCTVYPDESANLADHEFSRPKVTEEHRIAAAALADKANATFGRKGPYDQCLEWCVAGIASCGPCTIVTDARRKVLYAKIDGLFVVTFDEFVALH
jgi:hypothetical protein